MRFRALGLGVPLVIALLSGPLAARAQQPSADTPRIGVLMFRPMTKSAQEAFRQGLRDYGYVEGRNILVEWRSAEGKPDRANQLAEELARFKVSLIVAEFTQDG